MDRTKEYRLFVEATRVPQKRIETRKNSTSAVILETELELQELEREEQTTRRLNTTLKQRIESNLSELLNRQIELSTATRINQLISQGIRRKYTILSIQLTEILKKHQIFQRNQLAVEETQTERQTRNQYSKYTGETEQIHRPQIQREETSTIRKRELESIEQHINELGKMVTEVSMHIAMQGERLERIDHLFTGSKRKMKSGSFELNHALEKISKRRTTIYCVFAVLFLLLVLKMYI
ncbi:hypothetical protein NEOKW01_1203 [Nematocida sp. AWRm80]|nr:hypothetical protein NEOKW01_1203 [Nematocida sp. AWRm80]